MICPYCQQGEIIMAKIKKNNKKIFLCEECDTVWENIIDIKTGIRFDIYMKQENCEVSWNELDTENIEEEYSQTVLSKG